MIKAHRQFLSLLCGLFCLCASVPAHAERLPVRVYTSADGLGSSFVSDFMRDSRGFLWFCTRDGLSRFDGSRFVTYQVGDKDAAPGIEQILETHEGIYWIVTAGGLYRFEPTALVPHESRSTVRPTLNAELVSTQRGTLYQDRSGNLWSGGDGLYRLEWRDGKVTSQKVELNLPHNSSTEFNIVAICEAQDGSLWLATTWGLVRRLPDGREIFYSVGSSSQRDASTSLLEDSGGRIWLGRTFGIYVIKPETLEELSMLGALSARELESLAQPRSAVQMQLPQTSGEIIKYGDLGDAAYGKYVYQTTDGHIWISAGSGVVEYDGQSFHSYNIAQGLLKGSGPMVEDTSGNLWLGWATGVMRFARRGLTTFDTGDGLENLTILVIGETIEGRVYLSSGGFFLSQFDGQGFQTIRPPLPLDARAIWLSSPAFQDHAGEWWFLTNEKLYRFAASEDFKALAGQRPLATYTSHNGLKSDQIFHIFEDSKGNLWISVRGATSAQFGLSRWNRATEKFDTFTSAEGFPSDKSASAFAEDRDGNLWFGFYEGGIARYSQRRFVEFTSADGVPGGVITALHVDRRGKLWASTSLSGVSRIDDMNAAHPRFNTYTADDGLASNNVRSLTEDLFGNIYVGTARGIDKLSPDMMHLQHYSVKDGLAGDFVNVAFRDRTGALWFGTPGGLSRLVPEAGSDINVPPVWIGGLRIAGERRSLPELGSAQITDLELSPAQNNLQVDFFAIDFSTGEAMRYRYMLEGADRDWSAPTEQQTVNYANLAPGSYRFLVRTVNAGGLPEARPATISFRVLPPVWQRWWFISFTVLLVAAAVIALDRYRVRRMKELDAALMQSQRLTETLTEQRTELRKANRALELEYEVTSILAEATTPGEAAPNILAAICRSAGWDVGAIWNVDEANERLRCQEVWRSPGAEGAEFEAHTFAHTFSKGEGLPGRVWESGEAHWIVDLTAEANFPRSASAEDVGLSSACGFPITLEGEVIGVLEFFSREARDRNEDLLEMMPAVGGQIGQLIERRRADEALRESEDRFRTLAETASDAIITIDEESRIVFVNATAERVFGYSMAEMLGADLMMMMPEYLRHLHEAGLGRYITTRRKHIAWEAVELPGLHKSGREIPLELSFGEFTKNGQRFFTGIARDITERKQAEDALRRAREERLHELERVRTRIATDLHDDIGASLTQIVVLSEVARRQQAGDGSSDSSEPLAKITHVSNELVEAMSDIVWAINPKKDHLSDLVQRMRRFASDIFSACGIKLTLRATGADGQAQLGANVRRELFLIFKESVNNIARHSGCTEATVEFYSEDDYLVLKLSDDGKGFDPALLNADDGLRKGGNGLISMRRRALELGGWFEINSAPGQGASTILRVPLGQHTSPEENARPNGR